MGTTGSGSATSAVGSGTYTVTGYTVAEMKTKLCSIMDWDSTDAATLVKVFQAVTACGMAAATWSGSDWWWLKDTGSFPTVADTASYALRTVNSNDMSDLWAVERAYYDDDWPLRAINWRDYQEWYRLIRPTAGTTKPLGYAVKGEAPSLYMQPIPDAAYTIYVDYVKRHSEVTSASASNLLIVPAEYQEGIYVQGAVWTLRHDITEGLSLKDCPSFMEAIGRMYASRPERYDHESLDDAPGAHGTLPHNVKIMGGLIEDTSGYV